MSFKHNDLWDDVILTLILLAVVAFCGYYMLK